MICWKTSNQKHFSTKHHKLEIPRNFRKTIHQKLMNENFHNFSCSQCTSFEIKLCYSWQFSVSVSSLMFITNENVNIATRLIQCEHLLKQICCRKEPWKYLCQFDCSLCHDFTGNQNRYNFYTNCLMISMQAHLQKFCVVKDTNL